MIYPPPQEGSNRVERCLIHARFSPELAHYDDSERTLQHEMTVLYVLAAPRRPPLGPACVQTRRSDVRFFADTKARTRCSHMYTLRIARLSH